MGFLTCKYRKGEDGNVESKMFDSDEIPDGWLDSPADIPMNGSDPVKIPKAPEAPKEPEAQAGIFKKKRRKRSK